MSTSCGDPGLVYTGHMTDCTPLPLTIVVAAALVDRDGRVLIQQRPADKHMGGLWEFPGGKLEQGETPEQALVRELEEELGVSTWESCLAPSTFSTFEDGTVNLVILLYVCRKWDKTPQNRLGTPHAWVRTSQLGEYEMPPADVHLVAMLKDQI